MTQPALFVPSRPLPSEQWTRVLDVVIPGPPFGAARGKHRHGQKRTYKTEKHKTWEALATLVAEEAWHGRPPINAMLRVELVAVIERSANRIPKRHGGSLTLPAERRMLEALGLDSIEGRIRAPAKPDLDNAEKIAWDCLKRAGVIVDDCAVVDNAGSKWWTAIGEGPSTRVVVSVGMGGRWW